MSDHARPTDYTREECLQAARDAEHVAAHSGTTEMREHSTRLAAEWRARAEALDTDTRDEHCNTCAHAPGSHILHAHVESESADCDGRYSRDYVLTMWDDEKTDEMGDLKFESRVIGDVVSTNYPGTLTVTPADPSDPIRDPAMLEWSASTEEGFEAKVVRFCRDADCDLDEPGTQRDHSAEAAGY